MFLQFKMPSSGSPIWTCCDGAKCREKQRKMGAVYCDRRRNGRKIMPSKLPHQYAVCHNIQLPSFSAFHDIGHHLSMSISDSQMMVFWNTETCKSILNTNTLNEWCICWSFTDRLCTGLTKPTISQAFLRGSQQEPRSNKYSIYIIDVKVCTNNRKISHHFCTYTH
jgi:hypothetical protein